MGFWLSCIICVVIGLGIGFFASLLRIVYFHRKLTGIVDDTIKQIRKVKARGSDDS